MVKLALVSGSWPPEACGVGDYTASLADALKKVGAEVINIGDRGSNTRNIILSTMMKKFDIVHIQYPTMGYGRSLSPTIIPLLKRKSKICVTLHEFSNFDPMRRPWFLTFSHLVDARIFTNEEEKKAFHEIMRPRAGSDDIIPIASSIKKGFGIKVPGSVCNFGLITPSKGIEEFIELASLTGEARGLTFALIGAKTDMYDSYAEKIINECKRRGITTHINLPDNAIAELLSTFEFAYLPFPDGASSKRSSLLALQDNGVTVLTTHTPLTQEHIRTSTIEALSAKDANFKLNNIIRNDRRIVGMKLSENTDKLPGWNEIAVRHLEIYNRIL